MSGLALAWFNDVNTAMEIGRDQERKRLHKWIDERLQEIYDEVGTDEGNWYPETTVVVDVYKVFKIMIGKVEDDNDSATTL